MMVPQATFIKGEKKSMTLKAGRQSFNIANPYAGFSNGANTFTGYEKFKIASHQVGRLRYWAID